MESSQAPGTFLSLALNCFKLVLFGHSRLVSFEKIFARNTAMGITVAVLAT